MILKELHVENFGVLKDFHTSFESGFQEIKERNGWGKTTLATFLKVMFYGFSNEKKRKILENERKRYQPWQGGVYGGEIVFEIDEKQYRMVRTFGSKEEEDTFELYDAVTNLPSADYEKNPGEAIFAIDAQAFSRTIFLSQSDCKVTVTDSIHAKLGNLTDNTDDINNFEKVQEKLKDMLNALSSTRATGQIYKIKDNIAHLQVSTEGIPQLTNSIEELTDKKSVSQSKLSGEKENMEVLQEQLKKASHQKAVKVQKDEYARLHKSLEDMEQKKEEARAKFPGELVEDKQIEACNDDLHELSQIRIKAAQNELLPEQKDQLAYYEQHFSGKVPSKETLDQIKDSVDLEQELKQQIESCREQIRVTKEQSNQDKEQTQEKSSKTKNNWYKISILCIVITCLFAVTGLLPVAGIAIIGLILTLIMGKRTAKKLEQRPEQEPAQKKEDLLDAQEKKLNTLSVKYQQNEEYLHKQMQQYDLQEQYSSCMEWFYQLRQEAKEYQALKEAQERYLRLDAGSRERELLDRIHAFFEAYQNEEVLAQFEGKETDEKKLSDELQQIKLALAAWRNADLNAKRAKKEYEDFIHTCDMQELQRPLQEDAVSLETVHEQMDQCSKRMEEFSREIATYQKQIDQYEKQLDELYDDAERLQELEEQRDQLTERLQILKYTKKYLEKAKESMTTKFMKPVSDAFTHYYEILTGEEPEGYLLNADIDLMKKEQGKQRNTEFLSTGVQDLLGFCMRMSLVDAMYQNEHPFLILDDPFVNLDDKNFEGAKKLLNEIAKRYQVIYFTCNDARVMEK